MPNKVWVLPPPESESIHLIKHDKKSEKWKSATNAACCVRAEWDEGL